jgi:protein-S-isoprenylcysteine O-methyltransferase Ste14
LHDCSRPIVLALLLFVPAGRLDWTGGWLFLLALIAAFCVTALYLWRVNPEIFVARSRIQEGTKGWDRVLIGFLFAALLAIFLLAAFDAGRWEWSRPPIGIVAVGYVLMLVSIVILAGAQAVNRFFEPGVRIQTERGHRVIDTGPYAFIRHPGYLAASILVVSIALSLGSYLALAPAGIAILLIVLRTGWEDATLHQELPGYADYTRRVRYRLIPGIW